jgi:putative membrane protein
VTAIASGLGVRNGGTTLAPVMRAEDVPALLRAVDALAPDPAAPLVPHPRAARPRRLVRALAVPLLLVVVFGALGILWAAAAALVVAVLGVLVALDRYRQLGHAFDGRRLVLRGGSLLRRWSELDPDATVSFELKTSPGQRRAGLVTLMVHLGQGAGSRRALDLGEEQAAALVEQVWPQLVEPLLPPRADARS